MPLPILALACALLAFCHPVAAGADAPSEASRPLLKAWSEASRPAFAPAFALADLDGRMHELARVTDGVVLVHFFATWCEPCREELVSLRTLVASRKVPMTVLAVNVAEVPARVRRFLEGTALNFPVLLDADRTVTKAWAVHALPTTYVLDRDLVPRLVVEGDLDWMKDDVVVALGRVAAQSADIGLQHDNREVRQ